MTASGKDRAKIEDVARVAGVSIMSVSRAMRGVDGVSAASRQRILAIARDLGYTPSRVAGSLAGATSNLIGISVPTLFDAVFAEIIDGMRASVLHAGYETIIETSDYDPAREAAWIERMITWSPAAVVVSGTDGDQKARDRLRASQIPTLEIWDVADDPIDLSVGIDHLAAGRAMGSHLMSLGYRRPAYVGVERGRDPRAEKRRSGLAQAFAHHGVTWAAEERVERPPSFEAGHLGALAVLEGNTPHPDVICFLNDHLAFGGLMACEKQAIDVPGEIGIVGFNDLNINNVLPRALTTSSTPRAKMGALGAQLLFAAIQGVRTTRRVEMSVDLVPGETTRPRLTG